MKPWLAGDLSGVEIRAELGVIRDVLLAAVHRGECVRPLVRAVAASDPVAAAELCVGPRALAHPTAVHASLDILPALEQTIAPSGLYGRLADLAEAAGPEILAHAVARHPQAAWLVRLSKRLEPTPGLLHLTSVQTTDLFPTVCALYARDGVVDGLFFLAAEGEIAPLLALFRAHGHADARWREAARLLLSQHPGAPVAEYLAALHGPDIADLLTALAPLVPETARLNLHAAKARVRRPPTAESS